MAWIPRTTKNGITPGGTYSRFYNSTSYNPNATFGNCMPNCTTYCYGRPQEEGNPAPVSTIVNAGNWHNYVTNGWTAIPYEAGAMKPGDIIEWPGHVASVERVENGIAMCSSSLYTGIHGRAQWPPGSGNWDTREVPPIYGYSLNDVYEWMVDNGYDWRYFEYVSETTITNVRIGASPTWILVNPGTGPGPGPEPPTPGPDLTITISPSQYDEVMGPIEDYIDFTFNITIDGIPGGATVSGGNTYPGLDRVYNTGWSYTDYTISGTTYRRASKTQTLRYEREHDYNYETIKYMYFNLTFSTGTIDSETPMKIKVEGRINIPLLSVLSSRFINKNKRYTTIHL